MHARHRITALGIVLLVAGACATDDAANVGSTYDPLTAFPARATWSWDETMNRLPDDDRLQPQDLDGTIKELAASEFGARGYTEAPSGPVNYRLSYDLRIHTWRSQTDALSIGSLSILMVDAVSGRRVWLGFIRADIDRSLTPEQRKERLRQEMREMLKTFPPSQPKG